MEIIDKKLLFEKKTELFNFISQYGEEYIYNVIGSLWNACSLSLEETCGTIYNPDEYMCMAKTEEEMMFYHIINLMMSIQWEGTLSLSTRILQLFSKFQILKKEYNLYLEFYSLLKENAFLNGNCCEVAAGEYPRMAEIVGEDLNENGHNLTIYEPNIVVSKLQHATIIKDKFSKKVNLLNVDTLFGLFPCEATIPLAEKAFEENKNLLLAFCGCNHSTKKYQHWIGNYWCEDVCMDFRERYGKEAEIINWPKQYGLSYPIMIRRKK